MWVCQKVGVGARLDFTYARCAVDGRRFYTC